MLLSPLFSEGTTVGSTKTPTLCIKVPVPTSEHVAEIVGKQGCKIKSLRVSTHTYIQTPARDQPPVFTISGYPEDVERAKRRIEEAADHFTKIRQGRENNSPITPQLGPDAVIKLVEVPFKYVGLVVGPKGHNIKGIQSKTDTFIMTPAKNNAPIFEIRGLPENVAEAEREIHKYIADRTGGGIYDDCENFVDVDLKKPMLPPKSLDGFVSPFSSCTTPSSLTSKVFPSAGLCKPAESSVLGGFKGFGGESTAISPTSTSAPPTRDSGYNSPSYDDFKFYALKHLIEQMQHNASEQQQPFRGNSGW